MVLKRTKRRKNFYLIEFEIDNKKALILIFKKSLPIVKKYIYLKLSIVILHLI